MNLEFMKLFMEVHQILLVANPSALLLAFALMLEALGKLDDANKLREALAAVVEEGTIVTPDIGGSASTDEFTAAIIRKLG